MKKILTLAILFLTVGVCFAQDNAKPVLMNTSRPWSFWYWMFGAVSKPAIKADLEGMKRVGLQGTYLMPIRGVEDYFDKLSNLPGHAQQLTPEFWDCVGYSMHIADSLGLQMGVHICDGFALGGGPWFTEEESMQRIVENAGKPIAAFAIPCSDTITILRPVSMTHSDNVKSDENCLVAANEDCWFTFDFGKTVAVRNVEVIPSGTNFQCQRMSVEASADGITFVHLKDFIPARQGWQNYICNITYSLPYNTDNQGKEKQYRYYRFKWTPKGTEPGSEDLDAAKWAPKLRLKGLVFHHDSRIEQWEGKSGIAWRIAQNENYDYGGQVNTARSDSPDDLPQALCVSKDKLIPLRINDDGSVDMSPLSKKRTYRIIRIGHESTGMTNSTGGGAKGLECDKFSKKAVNKLIDNWFCKFDSISHSIPHREGTAPLKYLHVDSWECGCQNWSENFAEEFLKQRGYDLMPWLPVMVGIPVESAAESERVLRDVRLTINDLINDVFFATVSGRAHEMGLLFSSESVAPTMVCDGMEHYKYADIPMGEYWLNSPTHDKPNDMLDAISGAHIYGKNIVQAEGFTEVRGVWNETPQSIKTLLDRNFALGMNRLFFHVNAHNPWMDRKPGMTLDGIGLFFQRDQTWYKEARPFVDYVTRCSALLQMGSPVVDIAVYNGDEMPRRSVLPDRLVPMLPGIFGEKRVESEKKRLANEGQPMAESPVGVKHSAGITDTRDWVNPLRGYQYDSFNADVLKTARAEDGRMVLSGGMKYKIVVVPRLQRMNPYNVILDATKNKIDSLRKAGVVVIDSTYNDYDFTKYGVERDVTFLCTDGKVSNTVAEDIAYTHRSIDNTEIYFLANQRETPVTFTAKLRDIMDSTGSPTRGQTYIYDAVHNTYAPIETKENKVTISLPATGSCFIISSSDMDSTGSPAIANFFAAAHIEEPRISTVLPITVPGTVIEESPRFLNGRYNLVFRETGKEETMDSLRSWTESTDEREKYFSGHCVYTTHVKVKKLPKQTKEKPLPYMLSLGDVRDIAHVWVNGVDCGIVWTYPYEVSVAGALKQGDNEIKIEVVNTWYNALRGMDEGKPPYSGIWTNARYRAKTPYLLPAGLLGPVMLHF